MQIVKVETITKPKNLKKVIFGGLLFTALKRINDKNVIKTSLIYNVQVDKKAVVTHNPSSTC